MNERHTGSGVLLMMVTAFLWSIAGLFIKEIDWNPMAIAGLRSLIASMVLLVYLGRVKFTFSVPMIGAALANTASMLLFVAANKNTTAANAILLQYLAPVNTAVLGALLLKERIRVEHFVAFAIAAAGMVIMLWGELGSGGMFGNILALVSSVTFSLFFIFMRMQRNGSPFESVLLSHWITAAICIAASIFLPPPVITTKSVVSILALGILQLGLPSILFPVAIMRITAVSANLIAVIEPVFNPVWVFIVLGEYPGRDTVIGGVMIASAVTAVSLISASRESRKYGES